MLKFKSLLLSLSILFFTACGTEELIDYALDQGSDTDDPAVDVIIPETDQIASMIQRSNEIRGEASVLVPVTWNSYLALSAQGHANVLAASGKLEHSQTEYGENLYASFEQATYVDAVNAWYVEKSYYDYASNSCIEGQECGHYTQIIWEATTEVGCGRASIGTQGSSVIVCQYNPPGNIAGELPY